MTAMPAEGVQRIGTDRDVQRLADLILDPARERPVVVVSTRSGEQEPWIDVEHVAREVAGLADVWVLPTSSLSWHFSDRLPPLTQVYGGAGRVYPVGDLWQEDPYQSPLRLVMTREAARSVTTELISDAMSMAVHAGLLAGSTTTAGTGWAEVSGTVEGTIGEE
ncbi:MAG: hypothetical protein LBT54_00325, partial [Bifidobacteriaceae bacterium]|nr:hypothetical protein [Bifidobacteriaceae bacterium]